MKKACKNIKELLYLRPEEMQVDELNLLNSHLAICEDCAKERTDIELFLNKMKGLKKVIPELESSNSFVDETLNAIENIPSKKNISFDTQFTFRYLLKIAAVVFAFVLSISIVIQYITLDTNIQKNIKITETTQDLKETNKSVFYQKYIEKSIETDVRIENEIQLPPELKALKLNSFSKILAHRFYAQLKNKKL